MLKVTRWKFTTLVLVLGEFSTQIIFPQRYLLVLAHKSAHTTKAMVFFIGLRFTITIHAVPVVMRG
ncbi:hypothetical protein RHMOL_Rhmol08G0324400 [Rhododendron molle]|uniref:Uncharacterized protein n=1 Tax=Rhododendron molle TaxID=49168 RepID=A0ACC0MV05_RHOML|nr:hypothetical protein RHMOL_Rhmol08G0324400 [Rhododendron molle]